MKKILNIIISLLITFSLFETVYAASATINVSSNKSQVLVGDTVTVTVKLSSSQLLGSWKWSLDYNSSKFKLTSGDNPTVGYGDGKIKSKSYTYKFKAIATGSSSIGVKNVDALSWSENSLSISKNSKTIKVLTQSEYQASLSKNNNLSSLSIDGLTLNPTFKSDVTEYKVDANPKTTSIKINAKVADSKSDLNGTGTFDVSEGENKFVITVTAQNGSVKKYTVIVNVIDPNPIKVIIDGKEHIVVKRESNLEIIDGYIKKEITINNQQVPGFYSEINGWTLIGLKDNEGETNLYIYNSRDNTYYKYNEITLDRIKLYPLKMDIELENYNKETIIINDNEFESLRMENSPYAVIHAKNLDTGKNDYFIYDSNLNTIVTYSDENIKPLEQKFERYKQLLYILIGETIFIILVLIGILIGRVRRIKKLKKKQEEYKRKREEYKKKKEMNNKK